MVDVLRDMINEYLENMTLTEEKIRALILLLKQIIVETAANRDLWDDANNGKNLKTIRRKLGAAKKKNGSDTQDNNEIIEQSGVVAEKERNTHTTHKETTLKQLDKYCNKEFVKKLEKA